MCIAIPGKVIETEDNTAKVDFKGNAMKVNLGLVDAKAGDYVLVHAGCAIEVIRKDQAEELMEILTELESGI
jgi:hydrogenase expression/formation protein HypC